MWYAIGFNIPYLWLSSCNCKSTLQIFADVLGHKLRRSCAAFPTPRASQVGTCGAAITHSSKAAASSFCFSDLRADSDCSGPDHAGA